MKFTLNPVGVGELVRGAKMKSALRDVGEKTRDSVEAEARRFARTGRYAGSIEVGEPEATPTGVKVSVFSTDPDAHIVEWGSVNNPPYAPLRKGARAAGLKLRESR